MVRTLLYYCLYTVIMTSMPHLCSAASTSKSPKDDRLTQAFGSYAQQLTKPEQVILYACPPHTFMMHASPHVSITPFLKELKSMHPDVYESTSCLRMSRFKSVEQQINKGTISPKQVRRFLSRCCLAIAERVHHTSTSYPFKLSLYHTLSQDPVHDTTHTEHYYRLAKSNGPKATAIANLLCAFLDPDQHESDTIIASFLNTIGYTGPSTTDTDFFSVARHQLAHITSIIPTIRQIKSHEAHADFYLIALYNELNPAKNGAASHTAISLDASFSKACALLEYHGLKSLLPHYIWARYGLFASIQSS